MDKSSDQVLEFEKALKSNRSNKSKLYAESKKLLSSEYKIDDVILGISKQIKALQNADCIKKHQENKGHCKMKCQFLPLNMLSAKISKQETQNKFETQCISDTQLIDLVQSVEAQVEETGITQEFTTSFCQKLDDIDIPHILSKESLQESNPSTNNNSLDNYNSNLEATVSQNCSASVQNCDFINTNMSFEEDACQADRVFSDVEESILFTVLDDMIESPILGKISPIVIKITPAIVCTLESFEKFEAIAHPIIEEQPDLLVARKLINSQIENKELFLQTNKNPFLKNQSVYKNPDIISRKKSTFLEKESPNRFLEDTILFSSDEENECFSNEKDLPPTCILQACHNSEAVLDKTMYVGFQTASNKTIQVNSNSFIIAQSILNEDEHENRAFTKLVGKFDKTLKTSKNLSNVKMSTEDISTLCQNIDVIGFKKSNGKSICMHPKALVSENFIESVDNNLKRQLKSISTISPKRTKCKVHSCNHICLPGQIKDENYEKLLVTQTKNTVDEDLLKINDENIIQEFETSLVERGDSCYEIKPIQFSYQSHDLGKIVQNNNLPGFTTASNKSISVSEKSLLKYKNIFERLDDVDHNFETKFDENDPKLPKPNIFATASNSLEKKLLTANNKLGAVSKIALTRSEKVFKDNSDDDIENIKNTSNKIYKPGIELQGFKTANNKSIQVSAKSIDKYKLFFQDIDDCKINKDDNEVKPDINMKSQDIKCLKKNLISSCCNTASPNPVKISDTELITHKLFSEPKENISLLKNCKMSGFHTASNKQIKFSKEKLANCLKVFDGIDLNINDEKPSSVSKSPDFNIVKTGATMKSHFNTGSLDVNKSEDRKAISSVNLGIDNKIKEKHLSQTKKTLNLGKCIFQTANNEPISISEEAFEASQSLMKGTSRTTEIIEGNDGYSPYVGFKTASNNKIAVSKETLKTAKNMFNDIDETSNYLIEAYTNMETKFKFQTSNNEPIDISEEAYKASQKLINPENYATDLVDSNSELHKFDGFKTASNNKIVISKETLNMAKNIFNGIDETSMNPCKAASTPSQRKFQFQTANNKVVDVSEEAIAASQKQLNINLNHKEFQTESNKQVISKTMISDDIYSPISEESKDINLKNILDTQVIRNFEETLYTEDFLKESSPPFKRAGSPILCFSKRKKRKGLAKAHKTSTFIFDKSYKITKEFKLKDLHVLEEKHKSENNIAPYIYNFNFENILDFEFSNGRNDLTTAKLGTADIEEMFSDMVNKTIIPTGWIENHLKLIIWKLLSYEMKYPNLFHKVCSVKSVIQQLKYRYDRELYNVQRPAIRKIVEKDDISSKTMVLCVVGIYVDGVYVSSVRNTTDTVELLLTDGWYCIKACIDKLLSKYVFDCKISMGTKLVTHGAELVNCEQGISPWEDMSSVRLKLFGNSTRRARWDARLGYHGDAAMLTQLASVKLDGGKVSKLRVFVTRVYPTLYIEKFEDGSTVTRSERLENLQQMKYESERQIILEKIYEDVEKEFYEQDSDQDSENIESTNEKIMETGSQIARVMKKHQDPTEFMTTLTESQQRNLQYYTNKRNDKEMEKFEEKVREKIKNSALVVNRNVVPLMKIRVASVDKDFKMSKGMISIWRPNEELQEAITEGKWMQVYNVIPTAFRYSEIQLSASRQSIFQNCVEKDRKKNKMVDHLKRKCHLIRDLVNNQPTDYNEIDTVGFVFSIEPSNEAFITSKRLFQNVFLADEDKNIVCINFWGGLKKFGFENHLETGEIVACVNLQKRSGNIMKRIPQYRAIDFSYFRKTPKFECLRKSMEDLRKIFSNLDKRKFTDDCVALKNNLAIIKYNVSPYLPHNSDYISKNKIHSSPDKANWDLSGLDFESTFKQKDTQELLRTRKVNAKIAKLKIYGKPPPISPLTIINRTNNAVSAYKSPLTTRSNLQATDSSDSIDKENSQNESSPALVVKNSTRRINVNPIKLNFVNTENEFNTADPFDDDFDASLPLSYD